MAATPTAMLQQQNGTSYATAFPKVGGVASNLDLFNIIDEGGNVLLNVDFAGVVHNPASAATGSNTRLGQFYTRLTSGTVAQLFADAFSNPSLLDILQIINPSGGNVVKFIDYLGVAH